MPTDGSQSDTPHPGADGGDSDFFSGGTVPTDGSDAPASDPDRDSGLAACEQKLGYQFNDIRLLRSALTHASGADHRLESNERLEFLGDAILGAIVCDVLFRSFPEHLEGDLTQIKSVVVSRQTCAKVSVTMGLSEHLIVGKGMIGTEYPASVLSDVLEALIAAIYLDGGMASARQFVGTHIIPEIDAVEDGNTENFKSQLQQMTQRQFGSTPIYQLVDEQGPDHSKCFRIAAVVSGERFAPAWGRNKKEAEQRAAANAIYQMRDEDPPHADAIESTG
jgi:ribonuclease-3